MRCFFLQISIGNNTFRLSEFAILDSTEKHSNGSCSWSSPPWLRFLPAQQKRPDSGCRRSPASCRCNRPPVKCPAVIDRNKWRSDLLCVTAVNMYMSVWTDLVSIAGSSHSIYRQVFTFSRQVCQHILQQRYWQWTGTTTVSVDCMSKRKTWNNGFEPDFGFRNNVRKRDS